MVRLPNHVSSSLKNLKKVVSFIQPLPI